MSKRQFGIISVVVALLILLSSVYQVGAAPPVPTRVPSSTPEPSPGEAITVAGVNEKLLLPPVTSAEIGAAAVVINEGFEGTWPASGWTLIDQSNNDGGTYRWGKRNCHPHTGGFAGWSVGGGAQGSAFSCSANYPNNVDTWAVYGPFNLTNASSASLTYYFWGQTEGGSNCPFDSLAVMSSTDGQNFSGQGHCGNATNGPAGNGYYQATLNLSNRLGQRQVWIAFRFISDSSITFNGITIDDVTLNVISGNEPPPPPSGLTAIPLSQSQILLSWFHNGDNETGFKIERSPNGTSGWTQIATVGANVVAYTNTGLTCGTTYFYRVRAYNGFGNSGYSNSANTAPPCPESDINIYLPLILKAPSPPPQPGSKPVDGHWTGTTSRSQPMSFDVSSGGTLLNNFKLKTNFQVGPCSGTIETTVSSPRAITNNQFSSSGGNFSFFGQFNTPTSASGTYAYVNHFIPGCGNFNQSGTWTAHTP